jgi:transcriptional regulator with GAF, ATPase, and Fis domain
MSSVTEDTSLYWKDISSSGIFREFLRTFPEVIKKNRFQFNYPFFIFSDHLPSKENLHNILKGTLCDNPGERHVIIVIKNKDKKNAGKCWPILSEGIHDIFEWISEEDLIRYVESLAERNKKVNEILNSELVKKNLVGESLAWKKFLWNVIEVGMFSSSFVLMIGESGTGKELLSRLIHTVDSREKKKNLVLLDCATIVPELSGSEFFGHEKGSYTNAIQAREGVFALANEGTLFLDEVGDLPFQMQSELLRVIQEGTYKRVGSNTWNKTKFRLVCATNKQLHPSIGDVHFRHDLYFRLSDFEFLVPSLSERSEDIPLLAQHFLSEFFPEDDCPEFDDSVMEYLVNRTYAGNVRELKQLIRRIALKHVNHKKITIGEIPVQDRPLDDQQNILKADSDFNTFLRKALLSGYDLREMKNKTMDEAIKVALEITNGDKQLAAQKLGVTLRALQLFWKKNRLEN